MTGSFLAASVAIVRRDDLLLIQRNRPPSEGLWTLPGGRLEPGETPEQCAIRELKEELGLDVFGLRKLIVLRHCPY
ncbi:MAG: NUDIX domain-containing protein, partial [Devosia sp.]|nr:NUDIX domain-containing protein [Devosia sp.]